MAIKASKQTETVSRRRFLRAATSTAGLAIAGATAGTPTAGLAKTERAPLQPSSPIILRRHDRSVFDTSKEFSGRPFLVYFGFTFCPDICPTSLQALSSAMDDVEDSGRSIADLGFVFVTLDPERDTPDILAEYVSYFHPKLSGLYGDKAEIEAVAKRWSVAYERTGSGGDYLISHPAYAYGVDRRHNVVSYIWHVAPPKKIARQISELI